MSKRQLDYLNELLSTPTVTDNADLVRPDQGQEALTTPREKRGSTLLSRDNALAKIASGDVRQITQLLLDPARVRVWSGNARHQAGLNEANCRDLIDAILSEGGQKVPAIVRRVDGNQNFDYEVIAGTRRHWSISWLRKNSWPDMMFLAQVHTLDDESAFRIADVENRARRDVSDFERARNYLDALGGYYGGKQKRMAERLRVSEGWLSKMLKVASLPDWAVRAFSGPGDIQLKTVYPLAQLIDQLERQGVSASLKAIKLAAKRLEGQQGERVAVSLTGISAGDVVKTLIAAGEPSEQGELLFEADSQHGRKAVSVLSANRNGITLRLHGGSGADESEVLTLIRQALKALEQKGRGLPR
jgi:ParB family transcriptional regulator, chromosome partitioning protein